MENTDDGTIILEPGRLDKTCFKTEQERLEAFARALIFRKDLIQILKGIDGANGADGVGEQGPPGPQGPPGQAASPTARFYLIPAGSKYIEIEGINIALNSALHIKSRRNVDPYWNPDLDPDSDPATYEAFDASDGIVGIGTLVEKIGDNAGDGVTRVYFTFAGGITETPNDDWHLVHVRWS